MDREKAKEVFQAYGRPQFKTGNTIVTFSRQTEEDLEEIENKTDEELVNHWKALVFINEIMGQVSLNELQRITLLELEMQDRENIKTKDLKDWFEEENENFKEEDYFQ